MRLSAKKGRFAMAVLLLLALTGLAAVGHAVTQDEPSVVKVGTVPPSEIQQDAMDFIRANGMLTEGNARAVSASKIGLVPPTWNGDSNQMYYYLTIEVKDPKGTVRRGTFTVFITSSGKTEDFAADKLTFK